MAGERANVRGCGERGAWRPGSLCMAGVRGGALAMRNFSGFGLHGARKSVPNSPAWRLRLRKMRQLNQLPPPPTRPLGSYPGTHVGQRIGQAAGREDPGRRRLFQKRRERSVRAVMVPKTPGEKPPGPTLSQAQAGGVRGGALAFGKFSGLCVSSSWKKRSAKRSAEGEEPETPIRGTTSCRPDHCVGQ